MSSSLCISVSFLQPYAHGRDEEGDPEWPPSPLRLFQALVAASAGRWNERQALSHALPALKWLEALPPPTIIAPIGTPSSIRCQYFVPDNTADLLVPAWKSGDITKTPKRTEKIVCPTNLEADRVYYVFELPSSDCPHVDVLTAAARSITHLGWGVDMAVGNASLLSTDQLAELPGLRWNPSLNGGTPLRVPKSGTCGDLCRKHTDFLNRISLNGFRPVPPLRTFEFAHYRRQDQPIGRPWRAMDLVNIDGSKFRYSHRKLIHIAGMVRHLAIHRLKQEQGTHDWIESFVAGHSTADSTGHRQLSYLPLPSVGHPHADGVVRRVLIAAPIGDEERLEYVLRRLAGQALKPEGGEFAGGDPPILVPLPRNASDNVLRAYTAPANVWHSFTPVILPGHDDHKPGKTKSLIERALRQSGIDQPCEFEWSAYSRFPKSYSAHKYGKDKQPQGYYRPSYLQSQTAVHLTLRFKDGVKVPGPITVGAGRHCGLGIFVGARNG